jgi:hypothetical protein
MQPIPINAENFYSEFTLIVGIIVIMNSEY